MPRPPTIIISLNTGSQKTGSFQELGGLPQQGAQWEENRVSSHLGEEFISIFWVVLFYLRDKAGWAVDLPEAGKGEGILPRVSRGDPLP